MTRQLPDSESRIAREFLLSMQRARAHLDAITVQWPGASAQDIANVSAYLQFDLERLIGMGITELKELK